MPDGARDGMTDAPTSGRVESWRDFADRFRAAMAMLATHPGEVWLADADYAHWPLGERAVMAAWHDWVMGASSQRAMVLCHDPEAIRQRHPLWVCWRQTWAHRVRCVQPQDTDMVLPLATAILSGQLGLRVVDARSGAGMWTRDVVTLTQWQAELDAISQRSVEALAATTLGL